MQAIEGGDWRWVEGAMTKLTEAVAYAHFEQLLLDLKERKKEMDKAVAETWEFQAIIDELELKQSQS